MTRRDRWAGFLEWLGDAHRNAAILAFGALGTAAILLIGAGESSVDTVGTLPSTVAGVVLIVAAGLVLGFQRTHQAVAIAGLVGIGFVTGILVLQFTIAAFAGRSSGLALPIAAAYIALCCTTASDLAAEWGRRIQREVQAREQ